VPLQLPAGSYRASPIGGTPLRRSDPLLKNVVSFIDATQSQHRDLWTGQNIAGALPANVGYTVPSPRYGIAVASTATSSGGANYPWSPLLGQLVNAFTVVVWLRLTTNDAFVRLFELSGGSANDSFSLVLFGQYNGGQGWLGYVDSGFSNQADSGAGPSSYWLADSLWHVYGVTRQGAAISYYRDGLLLGTSTVSANDVYSGYTTTATTFLVGGGRGACARSVFWSRALTAREMQRAALAEFAMFAPPAWQRWPMHVAAGGGSFSQNVAGSMTPTGAIVKQAGRHQAGSSTPTGSVVKQVAKALAGSTTPSGALAERVGKSFAGSTTPAGSLVKQISKALAGTTTPTGALVRQIGKVLAGSTTPTGALVKRVSKNLAGSITPTGALAAIKAAILNIAGSITATGALVKRAGKALAGSSTPAGSLVKQISKALSGSVTPTGALAKTIGKALAGVISSIVGALVNVYQAGAGVIASQFRAEVTAQPTYGAEARTEATYQAESTARGAE